MYFGLQIRTLNWTQNLISSILENLIHPGCEINQRQPYFERTDQQWKGDESMQVIDKTIAGLLEEIAAENPLREAIIHTEMGVRYNFKHLSQEIDRSARGFIKKGITCGDKVALWAHNTPEWLLSFLGLTKIGAITVPIDPNAASENLHFILEQSESRGLIISADSGDKKFAEMALAAKKEIPNDHLDGIAGPGCRGGRFGSR
jgi:acyl-CoA synthetase (AMP-forming)/AMP-acid ligase II